MIERGHPKISISRQCQLLDISRGQIYYKKKPESSENLLIMQEIDKQYLLTPYYGVRRMTEHIRHTLGIEINDKRTRRLMRLMGLEAIYRKPNLSRRDKSHKIYPYLLRNMEISSVNQVWSTDITYIPMKNGFMYLTAVIDWHSRYILSWGLSNSLEAVNCINTLQQALKIDTPIIFNTDQGSQFTCEDFTSILDNKNILISMDGRGRALDNVFIERFWKTIKYECVYLSEFKDGIELYNELKKYFDFYNNERLHQGLNYRTPAEVYAKRMHKAS